MSKFVVYNSRANHISMDKLPQDPFMLLSYVNTKLRDDYSSLDLMCEDLDIDRRELESKLAAAGFEYSPENNKFF